MAGFIDKKAIFRAFRALDTTRCGVYNQAKVIK